MQVLNINQVVYGVAKIGGSSVTVGLQVSWLQSHLACSQKLVDYSLVSCRENSGHVNPAELQLLQVGLQHSLLQLACLDVLLQSCIWRIDRL